MQVYYSFLIVEIFQYTLIPAYIDTHIYIGVEVGERQKRSPTSTSTLNLHRTMLVACSNDVTASFFVCQHC